MPQFYVFFHYISETKRDLFIWFFAYVLYGHGLHDLKVSSRLVNSCGNEGGKPTVTASQMPHSVRFFLISRELNTIFPFGFLRTPRMD